MDSIFSIDNPLMKNYFFYTGILGLKMLAMSILTGLKRRQYKAFANPEDIPGRDLKPRTDDNVERVRRAHLNDIENIVVFAFVSFGYIMTNPSVATATILFRMFTGARILHTLVYAVVVVPQPARALTWSTGYFTTIYMAVRTVLYFS